MQLIIKTKIFHHLNYLICEKTVCNKKVLIIGIAYKIIEIEIKSIIKMKHLKFSQDLEILLLQFPRVANQIKIFIILIII